MAKKKNKSVLNTSLKATNLLKMSDEELKTKSLDLAKEQFNLLIQLRTNQLENTAQVRVVRRNIARIKTIQSPKLSQKNEAKNIKEAS